MKAYHVWFIAENCQPNDQIGASTHCRKLRYTIIDLIFAVGLSCYARPIWFASVSHKCMPISMGRQADSLNGRWKQNIHCHLRCVASPFAAGITVVSRRVRLAQLCRGFSSKNGQQMLGAPLFHTDQTEKQLTDYYIQIKITNLIQVK